MIIFLVCVQLFFLAGCVKKQEQAIENSYPADEQTIAKGHQLFQENCSACHNFRQRGIGPNLAGVTSETSPEWLIQFIRNAPEMIEKDDARATKLFEEYKQYMPAFSMLEDGDIEAIMAYMHIHQNSTASTATAADLGEAIKDPVPEKIPVSKLRLVLEEVARAPASAEKPPLARINKLLTVQGEKERMFIHDLRGILYELVGKELHVFMDMSAERPDFINKPGLGTGLGSFAFHPEFEKNGLFYTTHTEKPGTAPADFAYADSIQVTLQWVLTEWKMTHPGAAAFSGSGREILRADMVTGIHGMQEIAFNPLADAGDPDYGLLYIGVGDGGATGQGYYYLCHDKSRIWGTVIRIDPRGSNSRNGRYGIPADNPFVHDGDPETLGEIWVWGFRNPHRFTWDPVGDGKMLISDIGQKNVDELNLGIPGADYGWCEREGTFLLNPRGNIDSVYALPDNDSEFSFTYPVVQFDHDEGNAISGGFVYSGEKIPVLRGKYIFGDIVSGRLFYVESSQLKLGQQAPIYELGLQVAGRQTTLKELTGSKRTDLRLGVGLQNELYIFTKADGKIWKVSDADGMSYANL